MKIVHKKWHTEEVVVMQNTVSREHVRDSMLDYLFQASVEEQVESFQLIQNVPPKRFGIMAFLSQWFSSGRA